MTKKKMKYKMNPTEKIEKWKEIIGTANNGDPQYSFRLFSELLDTIYMIDREEK